MFVRVAGPVIAISVIPLIVGVASAWRVNASYKKVSKQLSLDVAGLRAGEELAILIRDVRTKLNQYFRTGDEQSLRAASNARQDVTHWIEEAEKAAATDREKLDVDQLREGYAAFFGKLDEISRAKTPLAERKQKIKQLIDDVLEIKLLTPAQVYLNTNEEDIENSNDQNLRVANGAVLGLLLLGICGPLSGLVAGFGITRGISRSIVRLSLPIQDAAGKLNEIVGPITFSAQAGLEEIEIVLHKIADQIGAVVERLQESRREALRAEQLAAVGQMAAGIAHELRNPLMAMKKSSCRPPPRLIPRLSPNATCSCWKRKSRGWSAQPKRFWTLPDLRKSSGERSTCDCSWGRCSTWCPLRPHGRESKSRARPAKNDKFRSAPTWDKCVRFC